VTARSRSARCYTLMSSNQLLGRNSRDEVMRLLLAVSMCALLVAVATGLSGCGDTKDTAAKVNGQAIKTTDLDAQLNQLKKQYPQMFTVPTPRVVCSTTSSGFLRD